jgi:hypothetical protein
MGERDEFPLPVQRTVAERAAYRCSRCRKLTVEPQSDPEKSLKSGIAAHICAAASNGPRYDRGQTPEERKSIRNAIWLCGTCSLIVDKDPTDYTKDALLDIKTRHEAWVRKRGMVPPLPAFVLGTHEGLSVPTEGPTITGEDVERHREHFLFIENVGDRRIQQLRVRIQFPELIVAHSLRKRPVGSEVCCAPDRMEFFTGGSGGGSVTVAPGQRPAGNYQIEVSELLPGGVLEIRFLAIQDQFSRMISWERALEENNSGACLSFYASGSFQYESDGTYFERTFIVPLVFDLERRRISSLPVEENNGERLVRVRGHW